jgi:hypothetical protein
MDLHDDHDDDTFPPAYRELLEPSAPTPKAMRAWALERGFVVGARGPVPTEVRKAYQEAAQS